MKQLEGKKEILILTVLVTFIFLIGSHYFVFRPKANRLKTLTTQVRRISQDIRNVEQDITDMQTLKEKISNLQTKVNLYEKMLPVEKEIPSLLESLSQIASSSGVKIIGIEPLETSVTQIGPTLLAKPYLELPIGISARCGYHRLGSFINKLEQADRLMKVSNIQITQDSKNPQNHNMKLIVNTFVLLKAE